MVEKLCKYANDGIHIYRATYNSFGEIATFYCIYCRRVVKR